MRLIGLYLLLFHCCDWQKKLKGEKSCLDWRHQKGTLCHGREGIVEEAGNWMIKLYSHSVSLTLFSGYEETPRPRLLLSKKAFNWGLAYSFRDLLYNLGRKHGPHMELESSWELHADSWAQSERLGLVWAFETSKPTPQRHTFSNKTNNFPVQTHLLIPLNLSNHSPPGWPRILIYKPMGAILI